MRKRTKFVIGCLALTGLGILLSVIGFATGGAVYGIQIDASGLHVGADALKQEGAGNVIEKEETVSPFDKIAINMEYVDVNLVVSDGGDYRVSYCLEGNDDFEWKIEDSTLVIDQEKNATWFKNAAFFSMGCLVSEKQKKTPLVTVYVPENEKLEKIQVQTESGNISCLNLQVENLQLDAEYGNVVMNNTWVQEGQVKMETGDLRMAQVSGGSFDIKNEYGDLIMEDIALTQDMSAQMDEGDMEYQNVTVRDLKVENNYGTVYGKQMELRYLYAQLESGDCKLRAISLDSCEVESSHGNVEMELVRPLENYSYDLNVEFGDITLGDRKEGNSYHSLDKKNDRMLNIFCEAGDIDLQNLN